MGYLDPFYVTPDNLSTKIDVFSFGILLLEFIRRHLLWIGQFHLLRKGKFAVYDPRIPPPKDPVVRKQLALIVAKCVRSCRERRPSMSKVVNWFPIICGVVETVGRPVELRNGQLSSSRFVEEGNFGGLDTRLLKSALRYLRRVYSDLGFSSNLMNLMATSEVAEFIRDADGVVQPSSKSVEQVYSSRFSSGSYFAKGENLYRPYGTDKDAFFYTASLPTIWMEN